jgi:hypothetical protein
LRKDSHERTWSHCSRIAGGVVDGHHLGAVLAHPEHLLAGAHVGPAEHVGVLVHQRVEVVQADDAVVLDDGDIVGSSRRMHRQDVQIRHRSPPSREPAEHRGARVATHP